MAAEEMTVRRWRALSAHRGECIDVQLVPLTFYAASVNKVLRLSCGHVTARDQCGDKSISSVSLGLYPEECLSPPETVSKSIEDTLDRCGSALFSVWLHLYRA